MELSRSLLLVCLVQIHFLVRECALSSGIRIIYYLIDKKERTITVFSCSTVIVASDVLIHSFSSLLLSFLFFLDVASQITFLFLARSKKTFIHALDNRKDRSTVPFNKTKLSLGKRRRRKKKQINACSRRRCLSFISSRWWSEKKRSMGLATCYPCAKYLLLALNLFFWVCRQSSPSNRCASQMSSSIV
jgi:hypothetical protein